jgi:hypothetical protein
MVERSRLLLSGFVLIAFLLVVGAGWLIYVLMPPKALPDQPEIQMALVIVTAIAALMTLLFIVAAGFSFMNLTDSKQPLGLPEGSIRAMIALILIMVFIIFGIYLFRVVGEGYYTLVESRVTAIDPAKYGDKTTYIEKNADGTFNVYLSTKTSDDGARLAQQLLTTVGTLVVAVAGFYFGSTTVSSAVAAVQGATVTVPEPTLKDVTPNEGQKDEEVSIEITGTDLNPAKTVKLVRGADTIVGTEVTSNPTLVRAKLKLVQEPGGDKWDLVVERDDGKQAQLSQVFTITP